MSDLAVSSENDWQERRNIWEISPAATAKSLKLPSFRVSYAVHNIALKFG